MLIKRKLYSDKEDKDRRKKSDKNWDSALGAGIGAGLGVSGSVKLKKATRKLRNTSNEKFILDANEKAGFYKKGEKLKNVADRSLHLSPSEVVEQDNLRKELDLINKKSHKALKKFKVKKKLSKVGIAALPILGAGVGSLYGYQNNLKKQRDKIENAAGDKAAQIIRGKN